MGGNTGYMVLFFFLFNVVSLPFILFYFILFIFFLINNLSVAFFCSTSGLINFQPPAPIANWMHWSILVGKDEFLFSLNDFSAHWHTHTHWYTHAWEWMSLGVVRASEKKKKKKEWNSLKKKKTSNQLWGSEEKSKNWPVNELHQWQELHALVRSVSMPAMEIMHKRPTCIYYTMHSILKNLIHELSRRSWLYKLSSFKIFIFEDMGNIWIQWIK